MSRTLKNLLVIFVLAAPTFILLSWAAYVQQGLQQEQSFNLPIQGYDPRDIVMGHYFQFRIDYASADYKKLESTLKDPALLVKEQGPQRFYIDEQDGPWLDAYFRKNPTQFSVMVKIHQGTLHLQQLLINGQDYRETMRTHPIIITE